MKKKNTPVFRYLELNLGNSSAYTDRFTRERLKPDTELETHAHAACANRRELLHGGINERADKPIPG